MFKPRSEDVKIITRYLQTNYDDHHLTNLLKQTELGNVSYVDGYRCFIALSSGNPDSWGLVFSEPARAYRRFERQAFLGLPSISWANRRLNKLVRVEVARRAEGRKLMKDLGVAGEEVGDAAERETLSEDQASRVD